MKRSLPLGIAYFIVCVAGALPGSAQGQSQAQVQVLTSANQVIARYEQAIGGHNAWDKLHSVLMKGNLEVRGQMILSGFYSAQAAPAKTLTKLANGSRTILAAGCDGAACWEYEPTQGLRSLNGDELANQLADADFYSELDFGKRYPNMRLIGTEDQGTSSFYVVEASPKPDTFVRFYFDANSGLKVREEKTTQSAHGDMVLTTTFDDYRSMDGVTLPFTVHISDPDISVHLTQVQWNSGMDDSLFAMPTLESLQPPAPAPRPASVADASSQTGSAGAAGPASSSADAAGGSVSGNTYRNDFFGFAYQFPADWNVAPAATTEHLMAVGKEIMSQGDPERRAMVTASEQRTYPLLTVTEFPFGTPGKRNQIIQVIGEDVSYAPGLKDSKDYLTVVLGTVVGTGSGFEMLRQPAPMNFGGRAFYAGEVVKRSTVTVYQWYVANLHNGMALTFIFTAVDPAAADTQLHTLDSITFSK